MCEHVRICVLSMYKLFHFIMPEKCQNCKKTNEGQLKKFITAAQDAICSLPFPIVLYAKRCLSRTRDTNQTALHSAK